MASRRRISMRERLGNGGEEAAATSSIRSSSTSGTVSTAYTTSSRGSHTSSVYLASALQPADYGLERRPKALDKGHIESLVREFSVRGGDVSVPERWLTELGIGWVLNLPHARAAAASSAAQTYEYDAPSWIQALAQITALLFPEQPVRNKPFRISSVRCEEQPEPDRASVSQLPHISEQEVQAVVPHQLQFANFFQQTMFKMLPFVDWIVSELLVLSSGMEPPYENLSTLLSVDGALYKDLLQIQLLISSSRPSQVLRIQNDVISLLEAKQVKVGAAIWSIMEEIKTSILDPMEDSSRTLKEGSSDIPKATRSVISYIGLLQANYSSLARVVASKYFSHNAALHPLNSLIIEIVSSLEEKLAKESESFPDRSLRFLFLSNNSYFISQQLDPICSVIQSNHAAANFNNFLSSVKAQREATTRKAQSYMESYMQASWAPVLSCLSNNRTPLCFWKTKTYSSLAKFQSEFQKTYTTQKLWKVPNPGLRKSIRQAITKKIMPGYTKYIEDNNISTPRIAPHELKEMLQELFEG